jgi:aminoglycoside phosphotransferase family enzyme/predicted kinase
MKKENQDWFEMIGRLRESEAVWPADELPVELIQTHISVLLLGKSRVIKIKKPVNFGFLDYSTLELRRLACEREVELNRRLCPEVYLGVRSIIEDEAGIRFSGKRTALEYCVLMKRLPEERMLDRMVEDNRVREADIAGIATRLGKFHASARRGPEVDALGAIETVRYNWEENFEQAQPYQDRTITTSDFEKIRDWVSSWLSDNEELLRRRVADGHVCDGHGDLRCESVCITNGIHIFDCIEFNERFRCEDVAAEVAFLAMDLEAYGRPDLGYRFYERYGEEAGDEEIFKLFSFYRCYRAFVRGKVLSFQLDEAEMSDAQKRSATQTARDYFAIAARCAEPKLQTPAMIAVSGHSGTGKTSVARAIAGELGSRVVSSDVVRLSLFGDDEAPVGYGEGRYSEESDRLTYQKMLERGVELLREDGSVVLDATFLRAADREEAQRTAESNGAFWRLIECRLAPEKVHDRLEMRARKQDGFSEATWETYKMQRVEEKEEPTEFNAHLVLDTDQPLSEISRQAVDRLRKDLQSQ